MKTVVAFLWMAWAVFVWFWVQWHGWSYIAEQWAFLALEIAGLITCGWCLERLDRWDSIRCSNNSPKNEEK